MDTRDTITLDLTPASSLGADGDIVIPRQLGSVSLLREIGRGGMGVVWLGHDRLLGRDVAVKFLLHVSRRADDPEFRGFIDGARATATIRHPGLTTVYHADLVEGVPYLVMEYIDGPTLGEVLRRTGPLSASAVVAALDPAAGAVAELHERGVMHRDIKPSNILLDARGQVFVADFGLACGRRSAYATAASSAGGSPAYMAPEMFDGVVSPRTDVYALGITAFELLTGALPFATGSLDDARAKHRQVPVPLERLEARGVARTMIDLIERATHKDAMFRHKSAGQFQRALLEACPDSAPRGPAVLAPLVSACRGASPVTSRDMQPPATASYRDRMAALAATKRRSAPSHAPQVIEPTAIKSAPGEGDAFVGMSIACVSCGYDLRGLPALGRCPECGAPVIDSIGSGRLLFAPRAWLKSVRRGLITIMLALGGLLATAIGFPLIAGVITSLGSGHMRSRTLDKDYPEALGMAAIGAMIVALAGLAMVTRCESGRSLLRAASLGALVARLAALTSVVLATAAYIYRREQSTALVVLALALIAAVTVTAASFLLHLRGLTLRIPERRQAKIAKTLAVVVVVAAVLYPAAGLSHSILPNPARFVVDAACAIADGLLLLYVGVGTFGLLVRFRRTCGRLLAEGLDRAAVLTYPGPQPQTGGGGLSADLQSRGPTSATEAGHECTGPGVTNFVARADRAPQPAARPRGRALLDWPESW